MSQTGTGTGQNELCTQKAGNVQAVESDLAD